MTREHHYESIDAESGAGLAHWFSSSGISSQHGIDHIVEAGHLRAYRDPGHPPREAELFVESLNPAVAYYDGSQHARVKLQNQDPDSEFAIAGTHEFHVLPGAEAPGRVELASEANIEGDHLRCVSTLDFD